MHYLIKIAFAAYLAIYFALVSIRCTIAHLVSLLCTQNFKKMQLEYFLAGMEPFSSDEQSYCLVVDVSSRDDSVFDRINNALNLPGRVRTVDMELLKSAQTERWEKMRAAKKPASNE